MRSNWIIILVLYSLKNQSQCWNSSTVPRPNLNVQRKAKSRKPLSCCSLPSGPRCFSLQPCSRNKWKIPVLPPSSRTATGKGQSAGRSVLGHGAGSWERPQNSAAPAWCGGTRSLLERQGGGTRYSGQQARCILPHGLGGDRSSQGMLGFPSWGQKRLFILFSVDFRLSHTHFIYRNCFKPLTWATLLIWVKGNKNLASWQL